VTGRRSTHTGIAHAEAECLHCPFKVYSRNSLGLAAQHADRHPDHEVHAEQGLIVIYNKRGEKGS
jgi:hypothetical protein